MPTDASLLTPARDPRLAFGHLVTVIVVRLGTANNYYYRPGCSARMIGRESRDSWMGAIIARLRQI